MRVLAGHCSAAKQHDEGQHSLRDRAYRLYLKGIRNSGEDHSENNIAAV